MSFQSQLLGATRAVTGLMAKDDPELERQFTNSVKWGSTKHVQQIPKRFR